MPWANLKCIIIINMPLLWILGAPRQLAGACWASSENIWENCNCHFKVWACHHLCKCQTGDTLGMNYAVNCCVIMCDTMVFSFTFFSLWQYPHVHELMQHQPNIRVVEMSMNDSWFRDTGPTVRNLIILISLFTILLSWLTLSWFLVCYPWRRIRCRTRRANNSGDWLGI